MSWYYNNQLFDQAPEEYLGFVYEITDTLNQKYYIGKKLFWTTRKLPPLKGRKNKRHKRVETDWREYYSSSDALNAERKLIGNQYFKRKILIMCENKNQMSYFEAREQFARDVLLDKNYYNGFIGCKISAKGLKNEDV
jgi:hypothetical protein